MRGWSPVKMPRTRFSCRVGTFLERFAYSSGYVGHLFSLLLLGPSLTAAVRDGGKDQNLSDVPESAYKGYFRY